MKYSFYFEEKYKIEKNVHVLPLEDESVESVEVKLVENFVEA